MLIDEAAAAALALPGVTEADHHGRRSFRVGRGKVLATVPAEGVLNVMVGEDLAHAVSAQPGVELLWWGTRLSGVRVELAAVDPALVEELLHDAWARRTCGRTGRGVRSTERDLDLSRRDRETASPQPRHVSTAVSLPHPGTITRTTETHCPYCSLQCGMTMTAGDRPGHPGRRRTSRPTAAGCAPRAGSAAELLDHPERLTRPLVRDRPGRPHQPAASRAAGTTPWTGSSRRSDAPRPSTAGRGRLLRRRRADQRAGLPARQVRPGRAAHQRRSTTTAGSACPRRRRRGQPRVRHRPRACRSRWPTSPRPTSSLLVGSNPADTMPPAMQYFDAGRARGAEHIVVDPRRTDTARSADAAPPAAARHRPGAGQRAAAHRDRPRAWSTRRTSPTRTTGFDDGRGRRSPRTGPTGSSGSPACPVEQLRADRLALARAGSAMILTARGAEQHRSGTDTAQAWINLALALGPARPAGQRLGHGHRPGQRAGRPRARAEGRPAARLPEDRPTRPPARTSPRSGASTPTTCRGPGRGASSCSTRSAPTAASGRCW